MLNFDYFGNENHATGQIAPGAVVLDSERCFGAFLFQPYMHIIRICVCVNYHSLGRMRLCVYALYSL